MVNKWILILFLGFITYAYISSDNPSKTDASTKQKSSNQLEEHGKNTKEEDLNFSVKEVVDLLDDPKNNSTTEDHKYAKIRPDFPSEIPLDYTSPRVTNNPQDYNRPGLVISTPQEPSFIEKKIINIFSNLLNTDKGQKLIDRLLSMEPNKESQITNKNPYHNNTMSNLSLGTGPSIECGQKVLVHYLIRSTSGQTLKNTREAGKAVEIRVGENKVIKGLEYTLIGMKKKGLRRVILTSSLTYTNYNKDQKLVADGDFIGLDVELIDSKNKLPQFVNEIQIFDKNIGNDMYKCGDEISINFILKDFRGKILFESSKNSMTSNFRIGDPRVPYALNKVSEGLFKGGARTAILPSAALKNIDGKVTNYLPKNIKIPEDEYILLEVESLKSN